MFHLELPALEKILRPVLVYFFLVGLLRIFGKRELAQLNPFDFVVLLSLSNTVQNAIIGEDNSVIGGMIGALTLVLINYLTIRFLRSHREADRVVEGEPTVLIEDGRIIKAALNEEMISEGDLLVVVRKQGFASFEDVASCVLEPNGSFAIVPKKPTTGEAEQAALMRELTELKQEIASLKGILARSSHTLS